MNIAVLISRYNPDGGPAAPLYTMLCESLVQRGHNVTVISAVPHYPSGRVPDKFRGKLIQRSWENGVKVVRVFLPSVNRYALKQRFIQFLFYQLLASLAGLSEKYDVLLVGNPALEFWLPYMLLSTFRHKPAVASVHDVYPNVGISLGIFRHKLIISAIRFFESTYLKRSNSVRILSDSFIQPLRALGIPEEKMVLVYDWVDTDLIKPLPKANSFACENQFDKDFVVLYAGNIGLSQGLEQVLVAAEFLKDHEEIKFVFVGEGAGREPLISQAAQRDLGNVRFLPFQPRSRLPEVLATADVSLITLKKGIGTASLPSKSFSILASGRPLLASVDEGSDIWKLVQRSEAGICVPPEDSIALAETILNFEKNPDLRKLFGEKGREYALRYHSPQTAAKEFEELLLSAIKNYV